MALGFNILVFFLNTTWRQKVKDQALDMPVESLSAMIVAQQSVSQAWIHAKFGSLAPNEAPEIMKDNGQMKSSSFIKRLQN